MLRRASWMAALSIGACMLAIVPSVFAKNLPAASLAVTNIEFPKPANQLVTGTSVLVVAKSPAGAKAFKARIGGKDVSRSFKRTGARTWSARLIVGKQLKRGVNHLSTSVALAKSRKAAGTKRLLVARPGKATLRASVSSGGGQFNARLKLLKKPEIFKATLNGRRLNGLFEANFPGQQSQSIAPDDGLTFGTNTLTLLSVTRSGLITRKALSFIVRRVHPLASAGRDRRAHAGQSVKLSGLHTRRLRPATSFQWRIIRKPAGSRARLTGASTSTPKLVGDVNGTYRLRLVVKGGGKGAGTDISTVKVLPNYPPMGAALDTAVPQPGGGYAITLGSNCTANQIGCNSKTFNYGNKPIQLLLFDRDTMELKQQANLAATPNALSATYTLLALLGESNAPRSNYFGVIAALPGQPIDPKWVGVIQVLNGTNPTLGANGGWSAFGYPVPNFDEDQSYITGITNAGDSSAAQPVLGEQQGFLQYSAITQRFAYLSGKYSAYNTSTTSTATSNTMSVGQNTFVSPELNSAGGCTGGVQLVVLSASTLQPADGIAPNQTFSMNCANQGYEDEGAVGFATALNALGTDPNAATNGPTLVLMQTIGATPVDVANGGVGDFLNTAGGSIEAIGGNAEAFIRSLTTSGTQYALVGNTAAYTDALPQNQYRASSPASTSIQNGSDGTLGGVLRSNHQSHYVAESGTPNWTGNQQLTDIAYQSPTAWPTGGTPGEAGALEFISNHFDIIYSPSSSCYKPKVPDVRFEYCDITADWTDLLSDLPTMPWPGKAACGCESSDWSAVVPDVVQEIGWVNRTYSYVKLVQTVYGGPGVNTSLIGLKAIASSINNIVNPPAGNVLSGFWAEVAGNILNGLSILPNADATKDLVQALSTLSFLGEDVLIDPNGASTLGEIVNTLAGDLPKQLEERYLQASEELGHLGDLLVTDYGKLSAANTSGVLQLDSTTLDDLTGSMMTGAYRFGYAQMLGATYYSYGVPQSQISTATSPGAVLCNYGLGSQPPFRGIGQDAYVSQSSNLAAFPTFGGLYPLWLALGEKGQKPINNLSSPPESLVSPIFGTITFDGNGVPTAFGEYKPDWFRHNFTQRPLPCPGNP